MRVTAPPVTIKDIWDAATALYGVAGSYGLLMETNLDSKVSLAKADLTTLEARLSAARAVYLDNLSAGPVAQASAYTAALATALGAYTAAKAAFLDAAISSRLATVAYTAERGTDGAALAVNYTAARAPYLDNINQAGLLQITAARAAKLDYLDNLNANFKEMFYTHFKFTVDDLAGLVVTGTATNPANLTDNNLGNLTNFAAVNQYVELNLGSVCYAKRMRHHGEGTSGPGSRYRVQAYVAGAWIDCLANIVDRALFSWSGWLDFTTPAVSTRWRFECTTRVTAALIAEIEIEGVTIG